MNNDNLILQSKAKVNLFLDILSKRDDGYHSINTVYQLTELSDELEFEKTKGETRIVCDSPDVPTDSSNTVHKSVKLLSTYKNIKSLRVRIKINKHIPVGAGLGGGSSNAAITLVALNKLFRLNLSFNELLNIAKQIGMDVPFHLYGGRCIGTERGEVIKQIPNSLLHLVLINTGLQIPTKWAYQQINLDESVEHPSFDEFINRISRSSNNLNKHLYNAFERFIFPHYPILKSIKEELHKEGAIGALMSGSGSTIYGIFENNIKAKKTADKLKEKYKYVFLTNSAPNYPWAPKCL